MFFPDDAGQEGKLPRSRNLSRARCHSSMLYLCMNAIYVISRCNKFIRAHPSHTARTRMTYDPSVLHES